MRIRLRLKLPPQYAWLANVTPRIRGAIVRSALEAFPLEECLQIAGLYPNNVNEKEEEAGHHEDMSFPGYDVSGLVSGSISGSTEAIAGEGSLRHRGRLNRPRYHQRTRQNLDRTSEDSGRNEWKRWRGTERRSRAFRHLFIRF